MQRKIEKENDPCRRCGAPVFEERRKDAIVKPGQRYYFTSWFKCPKCKTFYMIEKNKVYVPHETSSR